jgi:methionyl-tRNA formyltransferase
MNIFILTQEDAFYIPKLLKIFFSEKNPNAKIVGAAILKGEIAAEKIGTYFRFLGFTAFVLTGIAFLKYRLMDALDRIFHLESSFSVSGFFRKQNIKPHRVPNINSPRFHSILKQLDTELVISIACPQVIKKELLRLPPKGCINIHGALLPKYRGYLPSFWVLANNETKTGVTVHYVNERLDDGPIIVQKEVDIDETDTLHSLVLKSKVNYGGYALAEAVSLIINNSVSLKENDASQATYFSFPDDEAKKRFLNHGRKFR